MVCVVYGLYGMLEFKLCCEILLLLNMIDGILWNNKAEYLVHSMHMNRLSACRSFVVCIVGNVNGTRCRDGVKCHFYLVWLVF